MSWTFNASVDDLVRLLLRKEIVYYNRAMCKMRVKLGSTLCL